MRITKRIEALAEKIAAKNEYEDKKEVARTLAEIKRALLRGDYYTRVETVSASGMSRTISIAYISRGRLHSLPHYAYTIAGCDCNRSIRGCGMDMLFAAQYNIYVALCGRRLPYQKGMRRYNSY